MLTSFGNRSPYAANSKDFAAYFQYRIGDYQSNYNLYFAEQPSVQVYKNEIFNKMYEYAGYDLIRNLEFHFAAYENKAEFIRFLRYEVSERLKKSAPKAHKVKFHTTSDWLEEKKAEHQAQQEKSLQFQIEQVVRATFDDQTTTGFDVTHNFRPISL